MEILNSGVGVSPSNWGKQTPWLLKTTADLGLVLGIIAEAAPDFPQKEWVIFGVLAFKLLTNFIAEHPKPTP